MRKTLAILLIALLAVGMTACLEEETSTQSQESRGKTVKKQKAVSPKLNSLRYGLIKRKTHGLRRAFYL